MRQSECQRLSLVREHLLEAFRVRGCRGDQEGLKTRVFFLAWQCFDLAVAHELNLMGNKLTANARELWSQERKAR